MDDLNKEQELLRNQLATSNIQRSQIESKLNQTLAAYEEVTKQAEAKNVDIIEKITKISELEGSLTQREMELKESQNCLRARYTKVFELIF